MTRTVNSGDAQIWRLAGALPCAFHQLQYESDIEVYRDSLVREHFPLADLEKPKQSPFEKIGANAKLGEVRIGVQARSAMRVSFNEKPCRTLILCLAGSSHVESNGVRYDLRAGSEALLGVGGGGWAEMGAGASALVTFEASAVNEAIGSINASQDQSLPDHETLMDSSIMVRRGHEKSITGALRLAMLASEREGFMSEAMAADLVLRAIALMIIDALNLRELGASERDGSRAASKARGYMLDRLGEDVTLTQLERIAGVSRRTLQMHFRRIYGMSPLQYLREQRLFAARDMLLGAPGKRITDIALACGFTHLSNFNALFRERFGATPGELRGS